MCNFPLDKTRHFFNDMSGSEDTSQINPGREDMKRLTSPSRNPSQIDMDERKTPEPWTDIAITA